MSDSFFLGSRQAACELGFPVKTTVKILHEHGVIPVDLGVGAGRGLRWPAAAVRAVADTLLAEAQAKATVPKRKKKPVTGGLVTGKSVRELHGEADRKASSGRHPFFGCISS